MRWRFSSISGSLLRDRESWSASISEAERGIARVEKQEVLAQSAERLRVEVEGLDVDAVVGQERVGADPAVGRDVRVLLADRLVQHVDLDVARRLGERVAA